MLIAYIRVISKGVKSNVHRGYKRNSTVLLGFVFNQWRCQWMEDNEIAACDAWCEQMQPAYVVDTVEGEEPWFTNSYRLYGGDAQGGEVCTYILYRQRRKYTRKVKG